MHEVSSVMILTVVVGHSCNMSIVCLDDLEKAGLIIVFPILVRAQF